MTEVRTCRWIAAAALVGACDAEPTERDSTAVVTLEEPRQHADSTNRATAPEPKPADAGRYTSIDPASCRLIEQNIEEGGYSRHDCAGLAGYKLEISESDLRQDIVVIAPDGARSELQLSSIVAKGAFNSLGKVAEWRGTAANPSALIVRLNVARGDEQGGAEASPSPPAWSLWFRQARTRRAAHGGSRTVRCRAA